MKFGMIGLGRMGSGMTARLEQHGHERPDLRPACRLDGELAGGARLAARDAARPLDDGAGGPDHGARPSTSCSSSCEPDDVIVDGGNSNWQDSQAKHAAARRKGVHFVDVGVSGGIWGLEVGFCLMAGGDKEPVSRLAPIFDALAPENGWAHVGEPGAGHFTKMIHNGIEYGLMQAYAEGFEIMHRSAFTLDLSEIAGIWRYGSVVRSWLLELLHEALEQHGDRLRGHRAVRRGLRRGPLDDRRRDRGERARAGDRGRAVRPLLLAPGLLVLGQGRRGASQPVRRPRRPRGRGGQGRPGPPLAVATTQENPLLEGLPLAQTPEPCVLVIFGASGDLTRRKIFPALYALALRRLLPERFAVVGAARSEWTDEEFRDQMEAAVREFGRDEFSRTSGTGWPRRRATARSTSRTTPPRTRLAGLLGEVDEERGTPGEPRLLPRGAAGRDADARRGARRAARPPTAGRA